ncbi:MAG: NAD(P)-binding domain-containing protein [Chloroflexi bacterium]|nr:NAD(P)-binding domain-containing protein [Chloroflexota bacterium]
MGGNGTTERIDTVVIGAGQTGLSTGYHLQRHGVPFTILDADARVGDHWRRHWETLRLYSPARSDGLPGMPFPAAAYHYPSGREMGDFLETYASRFALPVESGVTVDEVVPAADGDGGFMVRAGERRIHARRVIVATGPFRRPHVPDVAAALDPAIRQLHSSEYRNLAQLQDGPLLVVGVSHSGADIAYEAAATHRTMLSGHSHGELPIRVIDSWRARLVWPLVITFASHVLTMRTPLGRKMAPMIRSGGGPLLRVRSADLERVGVERHTARTVGVTDGKPTLDDGSVLDVANVVWCTGFQRDYGWVKVPGFIGEDGWPQGDRGVVASAPGLYFVGIPFQYGFTSMLVAGAGRDAGHVVRHLAAQGGQRVAATAQPATTFR